MGDREEGEDTDLEAQEAEPAAMRGAQLLNTYYFYSSCSFPGLEKEQEEKK